MVSGGRYVLEQGGLRVLNITEEDDGVYLCMAEVPAEGQYQDREITVVVYSEYT